MKCPKCVQSDMRQVMAPGGNTVDVCPDCSGAWLDLGEVYLYAKDGPGVYEMLKEAYSKSAPSTRICPRDGSRLRQARPGGAKLVIDVCPTCGGDWFDAGEIAELNTLLERRIEAKALRNPPAAGRADMENGSTARPPASSSARMLGPLLPPLPSLALRSGAVLLSLYGVMAAFMALAVYFLRLDISFIFIGAALSLLLSFLIGPWLMDMSLGWFHRFEWVAPERLAKNLKPFLERLCIEARIPMPRCGIIDDGSPNAFTYGHTPSNARLVLTRGLAETLDEEELKAVAAHEVGHIVHWDMAVMTLAALVPAVLYLVYRFCMRMGRVKSSGRGKGNPLPFIGLAAFLLYFVTEYVVLFLSRTREFYADRFSGEALRAPGRLASALVKIAYGLAGRRPSSARPSSQALREAGEGGRREPKEDGEKKDASNLRRSEGLDESAGLIAARALGIFDSVSARGLVAASLIGGAPSAGQSADGTARGENGLRAGPVGGRLSRENITAAMQWDLWNPWAGFYELKSTHPLPAKRIEALGRQAESMGKEAFVRFDLKRPESYWDEFLVDVLVIFLPWLMALLAAAGALYAPGMPPWYVCAAGMWAAGYLVRTRFSYPPGPAMEASAASLLKQVKVSAIRGIRVKLSGKIIGRGIPGYLFSEDLVMQDATGFLFLDYKQPMALFEWIFALGAAQRLVGQEVSVEGWYRRAPVPYLELRRVSDSQGRARGCCTMAAKYFFGAALLAASVYAVLMG
ncbi:MAG: M48 family metalloprotease [Elusimicrobia bacterium]|nr:M48 family metalloprotease [Elusimicrobiota bacterium]